MANGNDNELSRRRQDKHNLYLPYLRELGAMAILAGVLYGIWDIAKTEGKDMINAVHKNTAAIDNLTKVQDELLKYLRRVEDRRNASYSFVGPRRSDYDADPGG